VGSEILQIIATILSATIFTSPITTVDYVHASNYFTVVVATAVLDNLSRFSVGCDDISVF
jgi:hypothetical protein